MLVAAILPVVAELWSFAELEAKTRHGAESPKTRSCTAKWSKPLQLGYQIKALVIARRMQTVAAIYQYLPCALRYREETVFLHASSLEQNHTVPSLVLPLEYKPHDMHIK